MNTKSRLRRRTDAAVRQIDPDLEARRRDAARTMWGCEHPDRHHYRTQDEADQGLASMLARAARDSRPLGPGVRKTRHCCQVGWIWLAVAE